MKIKRLCDLSKKDIEKYVKELAEIVQRPEFICRDCCRAAVSKKNLCKPMKLPEKESE
jgi:hypothetical protein